MVPQNNEQGEHGRQRRRRHDRLDSMARGLGQTNREDRRQEQNETVARSGSPSTCNGRDTRHGEQGVRTRRQQQYTSAFQEGDGLPHTGRRCSETSAYNN